MRIGIHTVKLLNNNNQGSIIGGIIGTSVVRYDFYGPDVYIANKMESSGMEAHI
jgi:hypothetical protein